MTLPAPVPVITPETQEFWSATTQGRLLLRQCRQCSEMIWYPRVICPGCHSLDTAWIEASGRGIIYSFSIARRGQGAYTAAGPYVLAYVELEEGPRMLTNIVGVDLEQVHIGQAVVVVFDSTGPDAALPRFRPVAS